MMATSLLRSGLSKAKKAKNHVEEGLERVRAKPWAEPLGKALEVTRKIVESVEGFVPGANIIGGALSFGATLLNPEPSVDDLQKQLREIKDTIEGSSNSVMVLALEKASQELEEKIAHPVGEIKVEFQEVRVFQLDLPCLYQANLSLLSFQAYRLNLVHHFYQEGQPFRFCPSNLV